MIKTLKKNLFNIPGWRTNRKIIVIESDDWGSIRMPGKETYNKLKKSTLGKSLSILDSIDSLERRQDLQNLLELADSFKDIKNAPLTITFNTVMQNPNFKKIKESEFSQFFGVPFFESYKEYYGENLEDLWAKGIKDKLIKPQFHAREHLNEYLWLKDLRNGYVDTKKGFDHGFFGIRTMTSSKLRKHYLATYFSETKEEYECIKKNTIDGLKMFEAIFGFPSKSFIACNYTWPKDLESVLYKMGVNSIQCQLGNNITNYKKGSKDIERHYTGKKNYNNQVYTVRNVVFEPSIDPNKDWVNSAIKEIDSSFFWKKPAIISMHRLNFSSQMSIVNRDNNLKLLNNLIVRVKNKYPDVEFMNSENLGNLILGK